MSYYKNLFSCKNKTALVTGGLGLIGKEIVQALYEFGATVYVADTNVTKTHKPTYNGKVRYINLDIADEDSVTKGIAKIIKFDNKIDILVNSAYPRTKNWGVSLENVSFDLWKANIDKHLGGYFLVCHKTALHMKEHGGVIINLASIYGVVAPDFSIYKGTQMTLPVAYSAIKSGIIALSRYFAAYYAGYNIRVNSISPGGIFNNQDPRFVDNYIRKTPLGRMGNPKDVAGAVVYLASDASSYVTGQNLLVDGGWTTW